MRPDGRTTRAPSGPGWERLKRTAGMRTCPGCKKRYIPDLLPREGDNRLIQLIYPDAEPYQREQLQSGYCSDKCIDEASHGTRDPPEE